MSAVVSMPAVRRVAGRRPAPVRHRDDLLGRVHLAVRMARRAVKAAVNREVLNGEESASAACHPPPLVPAKVVGESAMLLRMTAPLRGLDETLDVESRLLAVQLVPQARGGRVRERLCHEPGRALEHASAHLFLSDAGYPDEAFDRLLAGVVEGNAVQGSERLPNHLLEGEWLDQIWRGRVDAEPADAALLDRTCLGWPLDVLGCSTLDLYLFTHVVMYASDMGRRAVVLPREPVDILAEVEAALAAALDADNLDLAAELLWTWPMLRQPWSPIATFAYGVLAREQDALGFLPGPDYERWASQPAGQDAMSHEDLVLRSSYHATFVMGMLCAAALLPGGGGRATAVPVTPLPDGMADQADRPDQPDGPDRAAWPRWQRAFEALDDAARSRLAPLSVSVRFRRAAATGDINALREVLASTLDEHGADGPSARQALRKLQRAMAIVRASGASGVSTASGASSLQR